MLLVKGQFSVDVCTVVWIHCLTLAKFYMKVTLVESIVTKMQNCVLEVCQVLNSLVMPPETNCISVYLEKVKQFHCEKIRVVIEEASGELVGKAVPKSETLAKIQISLSLSTNQELLMEAVALDKIKKRVNGKDSVELDGINDFSELVNHMLDKLVEAKQMHSINGVPVPADFCCPLSLELMSDPVIVQSGQTYERVFIDHWFDMGYNVCPKTRQRLGHTNLIPNYTVKQLIENWSEIHSVVLPDPVNLLSSTFPISLNLTNGSASDKSPSSDEAPMAKMSVSSEYNDHMSSDDSRHRNLMHDSSDSDDQTSKASSSEGGYNSEADPLVLPVVAKETRKSLCNERMSGSGTVKQTRDDVFEVSNVEQHPQSNDSSSDIGTAAASSSNPPDISKDIEEPSSSKGIASETVQNGPTTTCSKIEPASLPKPRLGGIRSRSQLRWQQQPERTVKLGSRSDFPGVEAQLCKLIGDLKIDSAELQRAATGELRLLSRHNMENRVAIGSCGAIPLLVHLLHAADPSTQENAVTVLMNLSLNDNNKIAIASAEAIEPIIYVLQTGNPEAKANSAATLYSLSVIEDNKAKIGRAGAIKPLVDLLADGSAQGKKDAATALFNLSIFHENKARIVQAGAVKHLVELMDPAAGMVDKAVAVLANLATLQEGRNDIAQASGIPVLVEVVELGSARAKEHAAAALLQICTNCTRFCRLVLQEGAVPPLVALSQSGTARGREKAQVLLSYIRNQRQGKVSRR
ncbi:hypothetical protein EJB05_18196, partial [Eragrostis curvula]